MESHMFDRGTEHDEIPLELPPLSKKGENDWSDLHDARIMKQRGITRRIKACLHQEAVILQYL